MARKKALSLLAMASALSLGLTACSSGGGGDEEFQIGYVLPETGDLAFLGPPQISAAEMAIADINEAGGVMDTDVPEMEAGDEANDAAQANEAANRLVDQDVNMVLGAAASGMTHAIYDTVTGAGIVQCSGSNTDPDLTDIEDDGFYYRTAPSDLLSAPVLGERIVNDGHTSIAVANRADGYGDGYSEALVETAEAAGVEVEASEGYDPETTDFSSIAGDLEESDADAYVVVAFEEGTQLLGDLLEAGVSAEDLYVTDGMNDPEIGASIDEDNPEVVAGMTAAAPSADNQEFQDRLQEHDPDLDVFQFAPQVYDCVVATALAAEQAGSTDPTEYVDSMTEVTQNGTECADFAECRDLIADGEDIDYQGASGPIAWDDNGDPTVASIGLFKFDEETGEHGVDEYVDSSAE
ncbi:branched-chain amino acid transport system substrate-binding protein [Lipingzhangella halophila]|uniref:Branched-chain amino acid transport system substrate-binding protein n=1 Tax=Lipingzhangella halophila TaxID=1783352 RepID=A0A7W7RFK1_9ACTN|nr:ABC transporter substrate-binding protein [Lipingzhangella halophila]MBB4931044.1 branched-chain amino acid transport system substrate-binding protein [Lipingzhangella halophila]